MNINIRSVRAAIWNAAFCTAAVKWNIFATRGGMRTVTGFLLGFPKAVSLHFNNDGAHGPSWLSMSTYFCVVRQTWGACPSVFVGLCSLKSQGECLGVISTYPLPASHLPRLSPRSALSLTWSHSLNGWRRNMIKTNSWTDSKSLRGKEEGGQSDCIIKVFRRVEDMSGTRKEQLWQ